MDSTSSCEFNGLLDAEYVAKSHTEYPTAAITQCQTSLYDVTLNCHGPSRERDIRSQIHIYHMARTAPCPLSLQNYWEYSRMRAVRISASRAGKSRTALLRTGTAPRDAIIGDFVAFKHPSNLQPEKQLQKTY